jgi:hypothetical protein
MMMRPSSEHYILDAVELSHNEYKSCLRKHGGDAIDEFSDHLMTSKSSKTIAVDCQITSSFTTQHDSARRVQQDSHQTKVYDARNKKKCQPQHCEMIRRLRERGQHPPLPISHRWVPQTAKIDLVDLLQRSARFHTGKRIKNNMLLNTCRWSWKRKMSSLLWNFLSRTLVTQIHYPLQVPKLLLCDGHNHFPCNLSVHLVSKKVLPTQKVFLASYTAVFSEGSPAVNATGLQETLQFGKLLAPETGRCVMNGPIPMLKFSTHVTATPLGLKQFAGITSTGAGRIETNRKVADCLCQRYHQTKVCRKVYGTTHRFCASLPEGLIQHHACRTQEVFIVSYTEQSKAVRWPYTDRGRKKPHSSTSVKPEVRIHFCDTAEEFPPLTKANTNASPYRNNQSMVRLMPGKERHCRSISVAYRYVPRQLELCLLTQPMEIEGELRQPTPRAKLGKKEK